ncbi:MAG TPA: carboxypeptidase-like regulatory domain-containing protein [Bacteroidota bacterium]|nr:carboxypeptidase-like regulatory domain-containing protein [Bacteroidota bacterium]
MRTTVLWTERICSVWMMLMLGWLVVLTAGCSKSDSSTGSGNSFTISGETHFRGSVGPLGGVTITCGGVSTTSASDGTYQLSGVPGGAQIVTAKRSDCDDYSYQINLSGDTKLYIFMTLNGVDLSGVVSNAIDGPIAGAKVVIHGLTSVTDVSGKYEFSAVPHVTDTITVSQPVYNTYQSLITLTGSVATMNISLTRDSIFQGTASYAKYVDELYPTTSVFIADHLYLKGNGPDTLGSSFRSARQNVYINFNFPPLLSDQRVSIADASLSVLSDSPYQPVVVETFSVMLPWSSNMSFRTQPGTGTLLYSGPVCDTSGGKFWPVLGTSGFSQLLYLFRTQGILNGIVVKSTSASVVAFYSTGASLSLRPKYTIRARY